MHFCKYLHQRFTEEQVDTMENLSMVFQKQKRKKIHEEIEFQKSIQD